MELAFARPFAHGTTVMSRQTTALPLLILLVAGLIRASGWAQTTAELPSSKQEVSQALEVLRDRFGLDAVKLQSHLLQNAIQAGAVLTTSVGMDRIERVDEYDYLRVEFDTGLIYGRPEKSGEQAAAQIWLDVVEPTLRQFETMQITADGIALHVRFRRSADEVERVLSERRQDSLPVDVVSFRLLSRDVVDAVASSTSSEKLLEHAGVHLNGLPVTLRLDSVTPSRPMNDPVTPVLPVE